MPDTAVVGVIMGSQSDWETMRHTVETLEKLGISHDTRIISAHRTPARLTEFAEPARDRGLKVIIAGAGGAAALPGAVAALTPLPVLGVPMLGWALSGWDAMLAMVQMPSGYPVGTLAIGKPGAINAALLAASIIALGDPKVAAALDNYRAAQTANVPEVPTD